MQRCLSYSAVTVLAAGCLFAQTPPRGLTVFPLSARRGERDSRQVDAGRLTTDHRPPDTSTPSTITSTTGVTPGDPAMVKVYAPS